MVAVDKTLHQHILDDIEHHILSGEWATGTRIPYEVDLAVHYGCSRMTVNKVLTQLASAGLIERRRKAGTYVSQPRAHSAVLEIHDIKSEVESLGLVYSYTLKSRVIRKARTEERAWLDLAQASPVMQVTAIHKGGRAPFCVEDRLINLASVPEAEQQAFDMVAPGQWLLGQVPWSAAEHSIRAAAAGEEQARALDIKPGTPCLVITRRTFSAGAVVTRVELTYPGDRHELVARFSPADAGQKVPPAI